MLAHVHLMWRKTLERLLTDSKKVIAQTDYEQPWLINNTVLLPATG